MITTGFDPSARHHAWDLVSGLCALGKTVLLTTHNMDEAQRLADRVAVIRAGQIVAQGSPASIGGRDVAAVRVRFSLPADTAMGDLPVVATRLSDGAGDQVELVTAEPTRVLHDLTGWALERKLELIGLTVSRPSLEDVYLTLTDEEPT